MTTVVVDTVAPHVEQITLNRPERLNALDFALAADLHDALDAVAADADCRVVVLTGAGRGFCSGLDLKDFGTPPAPGTHPHVHAGTGGQEFMAGLTIHLRDTPQIVLAAVNGAAYGGGLGIAAASDLRLAGASATFCSAFISTGTDRHRHRRQLHAAAPPRSLAGVRPHRDRSHHRRGRGRADRPRLPGRARRRAARRGDRARVGDRLLHRGRSAHDQGGHVGQPRRPQPDARRSRSRTATRRSPHAHRRSRPTWTRTWRPAEDKDTMARHPFHEVVISGVYNTQQARVLEGHDYRSITFDAALGALADAGVSIPRRRRRHRQRTAATSCTSRGSARCGGRCRGSASTACSRRRRHRHGQCHTVLLADGAAGVYTERASTAPWTRPDLRVRRVLRPVHRGRVRASGRGATCTSTARRPRRWPRSPRPSATTARRTPRPSTTGAGRHARRTCSPRAWSPSPSTCSTAR